MKVYNIMVYRDAPTKNVIILVVTVTVRGPYPIYVCVFPWFSHCFGQAEAILKPPSTRVVEDEVRLEEILRRFFTSRYLEPHCDWQKRSHGIFVKMQLPEY